MVDAILGVVFHNLTSLLQNEFSTVSSIKSNTLDLIKADAEQKQVADRSIKVWLQQLTFLDECLIKSSRLMDLSSFIPKNIVFRHDIGNRLKEITRRFDQVAERKNKFLLREGTGTVRESSTEWRQTSSIITEPKIFGRKDDKEKIVEV